MDSRNCASCGRRNYEPRSPTEGSEDLMNKLAAAGQAVRRAREKMSDRLERDRGESTVRLKSWEWGEIEESLLAAEYALSCFRVSSPGPSPQWAQAVKCHRGGEVLRQASERAVAREQVIRSELANGPKSTRQLITFLQEHRPDLSRGHAKLETELSAMDGVARTARGRQGARRLWTQNP
jgi:hypothetical protein